MSYIPPFVSRIENDRPFLDDHLERVFAENPDLPSDELPPLDHLLAVMRSTHLDRVFRFVSGAYWAIEFAHRALRRAGQALDTIERRICADTIAAVGREVARYHEDDRLQFNYQIQQ
ncbi:hypothetical protein FRC10_007086, partial [Ceratobasidium sp. 414]